MGGADMAAYQQPHDPYAIKSDPEHGKILKKVGRIINHTLKGEASVKMFTI